VLEHLAGNPRTRWEDLPGGFGALHRSRQLLTKGVSGPVDSLDPRTLDVLFAGRDFDYSSWMNSQRESIPVERTASSTRSLGRSHLPRAHPVSVGPSRNARGVRLQRCPPRLKAALRPPGGGLIALSSLSRTDRLPWMDQEAILKHYGTGYEKERLAAGASRIEFVRTKSCSDASSRPVLPASWMSAGPGCLRCLALRPRIPRPSH